MGLARGMDYQQILKIPHRSDHGLRIDGSYRYDNAESNSFDHYRLDYVKEGEQDYRNRFDKVKNSGYQVSAHLSDSWEFVHTSSRVFRLSQVTVLTFHIAIQQETCIC